jgi:hypothetical protein
VSRRFPRYENAKANIKLSQGEEQKRMNSKGTHEILKKAIEERRNQAAELSKMLSLPGVSNRDLERMEDEAAHLSKQISALTESKMIRNKYVFPSS